MRQILGRVVATFIYNATAVIGSASILGGIPVWKATVLAGFAASVQVIHRLAGAYLADGYLSAIDIEEAFDEDTDA